MSATPTIILPDNFSVEQIEFISNCVGTTFGLDEVETKSVIPFVRIECYKANDLIYDVDDTSDSTYCVFKGEVRLKMLGQTLTEYIPGQLFGVVGFMETTARRGAAIATTDCMVFALPRKSVLNVDAFHPRVAVKMMGIMGEQVAQFLSGSAVYDRQDVLIVQDGGCSPGYDTVTAMLVEYFEKRDRRITVASQGFRSLLGKGDFRLLVHAKRLYEAVSLIPGILYAPPLKDRRGASFRSERFPEFKEEALVREAAELINKKAVRTLVTIGGNGTFLGTQALCKFLNKDIRTFFIPVTIDSDVSGTESIGQHTAVEFGAEKVRCYVADAMTHYRCCLYEMMGRDGGFHALYSGLGGGAHLVLVPDAKPDLPALARKITRRPFTVIIVSEGYERQKRKAEGNFGSASDYLLQQLRATGLLDEKKRKCVSEPFTRDVRGVTANNSDVVLAKRMAFKVAEMDSQGLNQKMPSVSRTTSLVDFDDICTNNDVPAEDVELANTLNINLQWDPAVDSVPRVDIKFD